MRDICERVNYVGAERSGERGKCAAQSAPIQANIHFLSPNVVASSRPKSKLILNSERWDEKG